MKISFYLFKRQHWNAADMLSNMGKLWHRRQSQSYTYQKVGGPIAVSSSLDAQVSLGKTTPDKILIAVPSLYENLCE